MFKGLMILVVLLSISCSHLFAETTNYTGNNSNWRNSNVWTNGVPQNGDVAIVDNNNHVYLDGNCEAYALIIGDFNSGSASAHNDQYFCTNLTTDITVVGDDGDGDFWHYGGYHTVNDYLRVGNNGSSNGYYSLQAGELVTDSTYIGYRGEGIFNQTGGTHQANTLFLANSASYSNGQYELGGDGYLSTGFSGIGMKGYGIFTQNGGEHIVSQQAHLGWSDSSTGVYKLNAGTFSVAGPNSVGVEGIGAFYNNGGIHTVGDQLLLAYLSGSSSTYELSSGTLSVSKDSVVGVSGSAIFTQTGGTHTVVEDLILANSSESEGTYKLSGGSLNVSGNIVSGEGNSTLILDGGALNLGGTSISVGQLNVGHASETDVTYGIDGAEITVDNMTVGGKGKGTFLHVSGNTSITNNLTVGKEVGSEGTYHISDGQLSAGRFNIGKGGIGQFTHDGGTVTSNELYIGANAYDESPSSGTGTYTLNEGALESYYVLIGGGTGSGTGHFIQNGGTQNNLGLIIGYGSEGSYEMNNGLLSVLTGAGSAGLGIGFGANGEFIQNGGTVVTQSEFGEAGTGHMTIGGPGGDGLYRLAGGQLSTGVIYLGLSSEWEENPCHGEFQITNSSSHIEISETLYIGLNGVLNTVDAGSTIHMTGSAFENESINPANLIGLANLTLIFEGGIEEIDPFEVASEDMGAVLEGYELNYALGTLQIGGIDIGQLQLVDSFDNQSDWEGTEALYVDNLILGAGSSLNLNGLNLYYKNLTDLGGTINLNGGSMIQIPEPCTIALLALGGLAFLRRRNKKYK